MSIKPRITPCLWFDGEAEAAARFYTSVFDNSRILGLTRYGEAGRDGEAANRELAHHCVLLEVSAGGGCSSAEGRDGFRTREG